MKSTTNPFMPKADDQKNTILFDDLVTEFNKVFNDPKQCRNSLPKDYTFLELDLETNGQDVLRFINTYYYNTGNEASKTEYFDTIIDFLRDMKNAHAYVIKYKSTIIATQIIEVINIKHDDETFRGAHADFAIVHPKFRKTFLWNVLTAMVYGETAKMGCQIEFWSSHLQLKFPPYGKRPIYNIGLTNIPVNLGFAHRMFDKNRYTSLPTVHPATEEEMLRLNDCKLRLRKVYDRDLILAHMKHDLCFADADGNLIVLTRFMNIANKVKVNTAITIDYIKTNDNSFKKFIISVMTECMKECVDMITSVFVNELDILTSIGFERNCDMYLYMMNYTPKLKNNEINMCFR